jgi:hypothetical protein
MIEFPSKYYGLQMNIRFDNGVYCIDNRDSGTGKSLLMTVISSYCTENNISFVKFDSGNADTNGIIGYLKSTSNIDVILLDNFALYATSGLCDLLSGMKATILISTKLSMLPKGVKFCNLIYDGNNLSCEVLK